MADKNVKEQVLADSTEQLDTFRSTLRLTLEQELEPSRRDDDPSGKQYIMQLKNEAEQDLRAHLVESYKRHGLDDKQAASNADAIVKDINDSERKQIDSDLKEERRLKQDLRKRPVMAA